MKTAEVRAVFDDLKAELVPLIAEIGSVDGDDAFMSGPWPVDAQHEYSLEIIRRFGFDESFARLDLTVHPFAASSGTQDIRLTTRYDEDDITSIFTAMHECGHGLYEHGVSQSLERTPLCHGVSSALHESQSRMWENIVGRSREFWNHFYPSFQEAFPEAVGDVDQERFYRAINRVKPSYIRVDADEATYNLHIILRFELEQEILAGTIDLKELPEAWNTRFEEYLGIAVPNDSVGVLQDVHWSGGGFGYFPTYSLGNIVSVQIWEKVLSELPDLPEQFEQGEFGAAARVAADAALRPRPQVHAAGDAGARGRDADDRRGAVRPLPEGQAGSARGGLGGFDGATLAALREASGGAGPGLGGLDLAVARRRGGHERGEQAARRGGDLLDGPVERGLVRLRRLRRAADLADVLERGRLDLLGCGGRFEVMENTDVSTHEPRIAAVARSLGRE